MDAAVGSGDPGNATHMLHFMEQTRQLAQKVKYKEEWYELTTEGRIRCSCMKIFNVEYDSTDLYQRKLLRSIDIFKLSQELGHEEKATPLVTVQGASHLFFHKDYWDLTSINKKMVQEWLFKSAKRHSENYENMMLQMGNNWLNSQSLSQLQSFKKQPNIALSKKFYSAKYLELSDFECDAIDNFKKAVSERLSSFQVDTVKMHTVKTEPISNYASNSSSSTTFALEQEKVAHPKEKNSKSTVIVENVTIKQEPDDHDEIIEIDLSPPPIETARVNNIPGVEIKGEDVQMDDNEPEPSAVDNYLETNDGFTTSTIVTQESSCLVSKKISSPDSSEKVGVDASLSTEETEKSHRQAVNYTRDLATTTLPNNIPSEVETAEPMEISETDTTSTGNNTQAAERKEKLIQESASIAVREDTCPEKSTVLETSCSEGANFLGQSASSSAVLELPPGSEKLADAESHKKNKVPLAAKKPKKKKVTKEQPSTTQESKFTKTAVRQQVNAPALERSPSTEEIEILPKPPQNPKMRRKFDKKLLSLQELLVDILRLEAREWKLDPLEINVKNAFEFGHRYIFGIKMDLVWINKVISLNNEDKEALHIHFEMDHILYKFKLVHALFEYKTILYNRLEKEDGPTASLNFKIKKVKSFIHGKFSLILNSCAQSAVQHLFEEEAKKLFGLQYDKLSYEEQQTVLEKFSICPFHNYHFSDNEVAFLFFKSYTHDLSVHQVCCLRLLKNLLCESNFYKPNDLKKVSNEKLPLSYADLKKYAAMRRLNFTQFHHTVRNIEPYLSIKELKTLHLTFSKLFTGRLKHIIIEKKAGYPNSKLYFRGLYLYTNDKTQLHALNMTIAEEKKKKKILDKNNLEIDGRHQSSSSSRAAPQKDKLAKKTQAPIAKDPVVTTVKKIKKSKATVEDLTEQSSANIDQLREEKRILQEELDKLRLAKLKISVELTTMQPSPSQNDVTEEFGVEEVVKEVEKEPAFEPVTPMEVSEPEPQSPAKNVPVEVPASHEIDSTVHSPNNQSSPAEKIAEISPNKEPEDALLNTDVSSTVDLPSKQVEILPNEKFLSPISSKASDSSSELISPSKKNERELSEGECSSSEKEEAGEICSEGEKKKRQKKKRKEEQKKRKKTKSAQDTSRKEIKMQAAILEEINKLNRSADILFSKKYRDLSPASQERVQTFSKKYDFSANRAIDFSHTVDPQAQKAISPLMAKLLNCSDPFPVQVQPTIPTNNFVAPSFGGNVMQLPLPPKGYVPPPQPIPPGEEPLKLGEAPMDLELDSSPSKSTTSQIITAPTVHVPLPLENLFSAKPCATEDVSLTAPVMAGPTVPEPLPLDKLLTGQPVIIQGTSQDTAADPAVTVDSNGRFCTRCRQHGHLVQYCIYRAVSGIPKSQLVACEANSPGAMITAEGSFVRLKIYDEQEKQKDAEEPSSAEAKAIESDVLEMETDKIDDKETLKSAEKVLVMHKTTRVDCLEDDVEAGQLVKSLENVGETPVRLRPDASKKAAEANKLKASILSEFFKQKGADKLWIKFTLENCEEISKEFLLTMVLSAIFKSHSNFVPICFHRNGKNAVFFARDCADAVVNYLELNLTFYMQGKRQFSMEIEIATKDENLTPFAVDSLIFEVVRRKVLEGGKYLDLSCFHRCPDLVDLCFCHLKAQKNLRNVLLFAKMASKSTFTSINLAGNDLFNFNFMADTFFSTVTRLDVRNNKIEKFALKKSLGSQVYMQVKELLLDGNPLCNQFDSVAEYTTAIVNNFPNLEVLDGFKLSDLKAEKQAQVFVCASNAQPFLEQFLSQYFSIFDSSRRDLLSGLYHEEARFSLTCSFWKNQTTFNTARLGRYMNDSRNLKKLCDCTKIDQKLLKGRHKVMEYLRKFPPTQHDSGTFTADVTEFTEKCAKISVSGLFRESDQMSASPRYFRRVFVLRNDSGAFSICNEMFFVSNCTSEQMEASQMVQEKSPAKQDLYLNLKPFGKTLTDEGKSKMIAKMAQITEMNYDWCLKCLEDMEWDQRNALIYFQKMYESKKIPGEAFITDKEASSNVEAR